MMEAMKRAALWAPPLEELAPFVREGLQANYAVVEVEVTDCPDLRRLGCASPGICGSTVLLEVGGEPYAHNPRYRHVTFDMAEMASDCGQAEGSLFGAGMAFPGVLDGHCGEVIATLQAGGVNRSRVARVGPQQECIVEPYASTRHSGLSNLFLSEGRPGPVLKVNVERRTGTERSFTQALRKSLQAHPEIGGDFSLTRRHPSPFGEGRTASSGARQVGMGGVFVVEAGRIRSHVMPDYECIAHRYYDTEAEEIVAEFLQFYEHMGPDLLCFAVCWTGDPTGGQLHLRESGEHTHFFHMGELSQAGHYHYDVTPDTIRYSGYFNIAAELVRIGNIRAQTAKR
ncbi:MAG: PTD012 family protein [Caldilineaceae bacterium SB0665_bin_25]|nr:PTD012 family protein [Caldilineaceae bacterium SB0665_bin_25]